MERDCAASERKMSGEITNLDTFEQMLRNFTALGNPWVTYRIVAEFSGFPNSIAGVIVDYLGIMKLRDWIDPGMLNFGCLDMNSNALLAGMIPDLKKASTYIAMNPLAFDYVKQNAEKFLSDTEKWFSVPLTEWLLSIGIYPGKESWRAIGFCESKLAIQWVIDNLPNTEAIEHLSGNSMAIDILRQNIDLIDDDKIWGNCAAVDILQAKIAAGGEIDWKWLSFNRSQWAIDMLQVNQHRIKWSWFSQNPSIFEIADNPDKNELMRILVRK